MKTKLDLLLVLVWAGGLVLCVGGAWDPLGAGLVLQNWTS